jgi:fumarate hydratase class I
VLDGSGSADLQPPKLEEWPEITWDVGPTARRVNLDTVTQEDIESWKPGETLLLSGKMLTGITLQQQHQGATVLAKMHQNLVSPEK